MPDEHLKFEGPAGHQGCGRGQVREITEIRLRLAPVAGVSALGVGPFDLAQALHCPAADLRQGEHSGDDAWRVVFDLSEQAACLVNGGSPGKWPADGGATHRLAGRIMAWRDPGKLMAVSYKQLTLPASDLVEDSLVAESF